MLDLGSITGFVTKAVSSQVGIGWVAFFVVLFFILIFTIKHILDISVDLWKLPFAILLDAIDLMAYDSPYLDVVACIGNLVLFWVLAKRGNHMSKVLGVIAAAESLIGIWVFPQYAFITNLLPTSTILMFMSIWSD